MKRGLSKNEREIATDKFREAREVTSQHVAVTEPMQCAHSAGKWGNLVLEAYDALEEPARAVVTEGAEWPHDTRYVIVSREALNALAAALDV